MQQCRPGNGPGENQRRPPVQLPSEVDPLHMAKTWPGAKSTKRRCGRQCKDGHPCQSFPVRGTSICRMHGLNQATRRKARRTLALRDAAKSLRQVVEREQRILRDLQEGR